LRAERVRGVYAAIDKLDANTASIRTSRGNASRIGGLVGKAKSKPPK
jgi:hypothetical protein